MGLELGRWTVTFRAVLERSGHYTQNYTSSTLEWMYRQKNRKKQDHHYLFLAME